MELNYTGSGNIEYNNNKYRFDLYKNDDYNNVVIKISVNGALCSYIELPLEFDLIAGEYDNGFKFTLIDCKRGEVKGLFSEGRTVFNYYARYMIEGIKYNNIESVEFNSVRYNLANVIEWGEISGYIVSESFEISKNSNTETIIYKTDEGLMIKYDVNHSMLPCIQSELLKAEIKLSQIGVITIESNDVSLNLNQYSDIIKRIVGLIELCTLQRVPIDNIYAFSNEYYDEYGDSRVPRPIHILCPKCKTNEAIRSHFKKYSWITLTELLKCNSIELFFTKYDLLKPIIDIYFELLYSEQSSVVRIFLNIVQALETYHSRFITNDLNEFKNRIDNIILCNCPDESKDGYKRYLLANSKKFITLESRIADLLLANFETSFDIGDISQMNFPRVIARTRNYYIHYDERIKEQDRILSFEELSLYNGALFTILEYYLLMELGFKDVKQIREKLKERWGDVSTRLSIKQASEEKHKKEMATN